MLQPPLPTGQVITYTIVVKNIGNTDLTNVNVTDPKLNNTLTCTPPVPLVTPLSPGQNITCTGTYTVTQDDLNKGGNVTNTATVTSTETPPHTATEDVPVQTTPGISIAKVASPKELTGPGRRDAARARLAHAQTAGLSPPTTLHRLAPPRSYLPCAQGRRPAASHATPHALPPAAPLPNAAHPPTCHPHAPLERATGTITYTVTVKNTGNVILGNVAVTDSMLTNLNCNSTGNTTGFWLAPAQTLTCTGTTSINQTQFDALVRNGGTLNNTATVTTNKTPPKDDTTTVTIKAIPGVNITIDCPATISGREFLPRTLATALGPAAHRGPPAAPRARARAHAARGDAQGGGAHTASS